MAFTGLGRMAMKSVIQVLVLLLGMVSTASAADVINGCYLKVNGQFRIVTSPKRCLPSERAVSFVSAGAFANANPMIYDANDQFLGVGQAGDLYIPSLRKWATINLTDVSGDLWSAHSGESGHLFRRKAAA